jgi:hypothetical protein
LVEIHQVGVAVERAAAAAAHDETVEAFGAGAINGAQRGVPRIRPAGCRLCAWAAVMTDLS